MKAVFVVVALLICGAFAAADVYDLFMDWTMKYHKVYNSVEEHVSRYNAFKNNYALIRHLNRQSKNAVFGLTKFADLSQEEFAARYLNLIPVTKMSKHYSDNEYHSYKAYPASKNWVKEGAVTPVKNQEQCGSCWSFSTTGALEGAYFLAHKELPSLSEQQFVDCDHDCAFGACDQGCDGGYMPISFDYAIRNGVVSEEDYPYKAVAQTCKLNDQMKRYHFTSKKVYEDTKEDTMIGALNDKGPLSIAVDATYWSLYHGGIYDGSFSVGRLNHGVLLVGYGEESGKKFWIIKNSWGEDWGEEGYLRLPRDVGKTYGYCNVQRLVTSVDA